MRLSPSFPACNQALLGSDSLSAYNQASSGSTSPLYPIKVLLDNLFFYPSPIRYAFSPAYNPRRTLTLAQNPRKYLSAYIQALLESTRYRFSFIFYPNIYYLIKKTFQPTNSDTYLFWPASKLNLRLPGTICPLFFI